MSKKPVAYIDGDIILHRAVSFVSREFDGEPVADVKSAIRYFDHILDKWLKEAGKLEDYHLVLSVGPNFRKDLYTEYKANRKDIEPHPAFEGLKSEVMERLETVWEENIEADDYIGLKCSEDPEHTLAISADKDFATVPCRLMIPASHDRKKPDWHSFTEEEADRNWMIQTLTGDVIDNYPGVYGVGKVKAASVVDNPRITMKAPEEVFKRGPRKGQKKPVQWIEGPPCSVWKSMTSLAESKGMTEGELLTMARLARILRHGDYDWESKEITLWNPKSSKQVIEWCV